jgi:hypothetical protein
MNLVLLFAVALPSVILGMAAIALGMARHSAAARAERIGRSATGCALLAFALLPCAHGWGAAIGSVLWTGLLAPGVIVVALALAMRR